MKFVTYSIPAAAPQLGDVAGDRVVSLHQATGGALPGDIVTTGTLHGVGAFRNPPVFLKHDDVVAVEVEGLGQLTSTCAEEGAE